jgi:hypothetical protein
MINKKILAAAIAAAFTINANAIDLDLTTEAGVTVASEATGTVTAGLFLLQNDTNALDFEVTAGFTVAIGAVKYVRIDLTNATFGDTPLLTATNIDTAVIQTGGAADDAFVVYEITAGAGALLSTETLTLATSSYNVSSSAASSVQYALYDTALDAINQAPNATFKIADAPLATTASVSTGSFTVAPIAGTGKVTATSASAFKAFKVEGNTTSTLANLGSVDASKLLAAGATALAADGVVVEATDIVAVTPQVVKFAGDFSVGTFTARATNCAGADQSATLNVLKSELSTPTVNPHTPIVLCHLTDGIVTVDKNSYTAELVTSAMTNDLGSIVYDTTSIAVPYLTVFSAYNQRIFLNNTSSTAANYTITFANEAGVEATALAGASGTVPGKTIMSLRAIDVVSLDGGDRLAATIEVETADGNISAHTQIVNKATRGTDTLILNN